MNIQLPLTDVTNHMGYALLNMIAYNESHLRCSMTKENNEVKGVKDDWRINKSVAVQLSKESHVCYASLLHTILIQLQPCSYSFQDLVTSREEITFHDERDAMQIQSWQT